KLFYNDYYHQKMSYPKLIILDEPDSHLHPEMSQLLISVLKDTFVDKLGINVIMTTHSPATVAMAPEESLWIINNIPETTLKRTTKDEALNILTQNIPTLSIDYENHRQVFVESPTDLKYYQSIFSKFVANETANHKLYFI